MRDTHDENGRHDQHPLSCIHAVSLAKENLVLIVLDQGLRSLTALMFLAVTSTTGV